MAKWYVRPAGRTYGTAKGTSYANAWAGMAAIKWDRVAQGDQIKVAGRHAPTGSGLLPINIRKSGVTIERYSGNDPAIFIAHYPVMKKVSGVVWKYIRFEDSAAIGGDNTVGAKGIKFLFCGMKRLIQGNNIFIELRKGNDDWVIQNCLISYAPNAIYTRITDGPAANRLTVNRCTIDHIGAGDYLDEDGHAVGIQEGSGHKITNNVIDRTGTAIELWARKFGQVTDSEISGNTITNVTAKSVTIGAGIMIGGTYDVATNFPKPGWRNGHRVFNNTISGCDGNGIRAASMRDSLYEDNNTITDVGRAGEYTHKVYIYNPWTQKAITR